MRAIHAPEIAQDPAIFRQHQFRMAAADRCVVDHDFQIG
jgi:hypothetical protein